MPRMNNGMRFNKTKTKNGKPYMTCWMVQLPNKNGSGSHWYGKLMDKTGKVIALNSSGVTQTFTDKRGVTRTYLPVDVSVYKFNPTGDYSGGMIF